jgi:hypothetical protein
MASEESGAFSAELSLYGRRPADIGGVGFVDHIGGSCIFAEERYFAGNSEPEGEFDSVPVTPVERSSIDVCGFVWF